MNQFDVYINPIAKGRKTYPYVCCLQNDLLYGLSSRVVAFVSADENFAFDKISVPLHIDGKKHFLCLNVLATIESIRLVDYIENVEAARDDIINAYDAVFIGI